MTAATVRFTFEATALTLEVDDEAAPRTAAAFLASLPATADLHCAKIAGNHLFWHAPFVVPLERASDVMTAPPGTLLYWPERQFLELIYGELQAETASVNVIGRVEGDVAPLCRLGERLATEQGRRPFDARLELVAGTVAPLERVPLPAALEPLRAARERLWVEEPAEIRALLRRRGVMLPAGPLVMAESEARKLQEQLWLLLTRDAADDPAFAARSAMRLLEGARARIAGFCGLHSAGAVLDLAHEALRTQPEATALILEETILHAGRLAAWLDRRLPWDGMNRALLTALDDWP